MVNKELVISDADRKLHELIQAGDSAAIIAGMSHKGAIYRVNGIINAVKYSVQGMKVKEALDRLKEDTTVMNGYRVSEFAVAALDVMGFEPYNGSEIRIQKLIQSNFEF